VKNYPPPGAIGRARDLRKKMTDAERALWRMLRLSFREHHFRKQVPIRHYIADFASHRAKLVIEVDGGQHNPEVDSERTRIIEDEGYRVLRFWNNEVIGNPDGVCDEIDRVLHGHHPAPTPPHQGEGL
jgi:very-short-patch-repair endonuclease